MRVVTSMRSKRFVAAIAALWICAVAAPVGATVGKPWHPRLLRSCYLAGPREYRQLRLALITRDRVLLREACDLSPWTVRRVSQQ
jgi:hypothetical protein